MAKWLPPPSLIIPPELKGIPTHPFVLQALVQRGIITAQRAQAYLDPAYYPATAPTELAGMEQAVERIEDAIQKGETIGVWGDFDVDGQTSTTVLVEGLQLLGAKVLYHIPVRETESHGVNIPELEKLVQRGAQLIITCDTGISAHAAADWAREHQVDFLVTDHHDPPSELPPATVLINPKFLPNGHPLSTLPGVGVAYKLVEALYQRAGLTDQLSALHDLVALGIIADIAELSGDARFLAQRGIEMLRRTERLGLQTLLHNAEINPHMLTEEHISFGIAPRLNAVGRLGDANPMVEFLTTQDEERTRELAFQIEGYNEQRKRLTEDIFQGALFQLKNNRSLLDDAALVLYHPNWHPGVLGIVASRLVERFGKPTILLSGTKEQGARGSARSIEGIHITRAIAAQAEMLTSFGGHPMAAGLAIAPAPDLEERIARFRKALSYTIQSQDNALPLETTYQISAYLPLGQVDWELAIALESLAPFGNGNPSPIFAAQNLRLLQAAPVGSLGEHLIMTVEDEHGQSFRLIWWQGAGWELPQGVFDLAYRARASSYNGNANIQLEWVDYHQQPESTLPLTQRKTLRMVDYRASADPQSKLEEIRNSERDLLIWAEANDHQTVHGHDRNELKPAEALAIWSIPPGVHELAAAIELVSPRTLYLFANDPQTDDAQRFIQRLQGLVKHVIQNRGGQTEWGWLTAATAQRCICVKLGLEWLAANGWISYHEQDEQNLVIVKGNGVKQTQSDTIYQQLCRQLSESAAYRTFYRESALEALRAQMEGGEMR